MAPSHILIFSLGNPGAKYARTWHSAGHIVLGALQRTIANQPPFSSMRIGKEAASVSIGPRYALFQSPTLMNVSGPWVARAYRDHLSERALSPSEVGVVLLHDDLESALGAVKIREWTSSHRGHNGIKSVNASLRPDPAAKWARVAVGIGRPDARDKDAVSDFVLSKVDGNGMRVLEGEATRGVLEALMELEARWGVDG
jgi:PTH1 family peptidyl-tRNA hydrolase